MRIWLTVPLLALSLAVVVDDVGPCGGGGRRPGPPLPTRAPPTQATPPTESPQPPPPAQPLRPS